MELEPKAKKSTLGPVDLCFLTSTTKNDVISENLQADIPIIGGAVEITGSTGSIISVSIRKPDGNLIEIS